MSENRRYNNLLERLSSHNSSLVNHEDGSIENTIDTIKKIDIEKLKALLIMDELHKHDNFLTKVLNGVLNFDIIDSPNIERMKLLHRKSDANGFSMITMLRNYYYINEIKSMGIKKLKQLLNSNDLFRELQKELSTHAQGVLSLSSTGELFKELQDDLNSYAQSVQSPPNCNELVESKEERNPNTQSVQSLPDCGELYRELQGELKSNTQSVQSLTDGYKYYSEKKDGLPQDQDASINKDPFLNVLSVNTDVLKMLANSGIFDISTILLLLEKRDTVETINTMDVNKFELLINAIKGEGPTTVSKTKKIKLDEQSNTVQTDGSFKKFILQMFRDGDVVKTINLMETDKFALLVQSKRENFRLLKEILITPIIFNDSLKAINATMLEVIISKLPGKYVLEILRNPCCVIAINLIGHQRLSLLLDSGRFNPPLILSILKHQKAVNTINSIDTDAFKQLLEKDELHGYLIIEFSEKECHARIDKLKILLNNDGFCGWTVCQLVNHKNTLESLDLIDIERFKLLVCGGMLDDYVMSVILENGNIISAMNLIDIIKFKFLITYERGMLLKRLLDIIDYINAFDIEKLRFFSLHKIPYFVFLNLLNRGNVAHEVMLMDMERYTFLIRNRVIDLMARIDFGFLVPAIINVIEIEKLRILDDTYKRAVLELFRNENIVHGITFMPIERLKILIQHYTSAPVLRFVLENPMTLNFLITINIESVKIILKMLAKEDILRISLCYGGDIKRNLDFAIALYKGGRIKKVDYNFLFNSRVVHRAIGSVFPKGFPIHRFLPLVDMDHSGPVPSLKDLCIQAWIIGDKG